jgi:crotonobetainyl-CoA:carnitine CoA-transferase CaiB-like acyl-CoA transferase
MRGERLPLAGVRVLDVSEVWAGPMATSYLADWGAEVIRLETYPRAETLRPVVVAPGGLGYADNDPLRPQPWERHARRFVSNHSKQGVALNMRDPRGYDIVLRLASVSDVLVENYAAGTMTRLGFGWDVMQRVSPALIIVSLSGWGETGPYTGYSAMGATIDASTGHASLRGYLDDDPTQTNLGYQADALAPLAAVLAIGAALHERRSTGRGRRIELSMAEVLLTTLARQLADASLTGKRGEKLENSQPRMAPHGCYPCSGEDRWITIAVETDADWRRLCAVLGREDLAGRTDLATSEGRAARRAELDAEVAGSTATRDAFELMEVLQAAGVAAGAVYDEWDTMADPHLRSRSFWVEADQPMVGRRTYPSLPWRIDGLEPVAYRPANVLGEHNVPVLRDLLGMQPDEIEGLTVERVIATSYH